MNNMSPELFIVGRNDEVPFKCSSHNKTTMVGCVKSTQEPTKLSSNMKVTEMWTKVLTIIQWTKEIAKNIRWYKIIECIKI